MNQPEETCLKTSARFYTVFALFVVLNLLLIGSARLYPFVDIPNHLALSTIIKHYGEADNRFEQFFTVDLFLRPNVFHVLFCSLDVFPTVEFGNRVFYGIYVFLMPLSVLLLIRGVGGNPWYALLSFLFVYNYSVCYGFVGYTIAIPFILLSVRAVLDWIDRPNPFRSLLLLLLLVLLFFTHALAAVFALTVFAGCIIAEYRKSFRKLLLKSVPAWPVILIMAVWWLQDSRQFEGQGLFEFLRQNYLKDYLTFLHLRSGFLFSDNKALLPGMAGVAVGMCCSLLVLGGILWPPRDSGNGWRVLLQDKKRRAMMIFAACSFCFFFAFPIRLPGYHFLLQRFSIFCMIALIVIGSILGRRMCSKKAVGLLCAGLSLHYLGWVNYFYDFNKENRNFTPEFFVQQDPAAVTAGLLYDYQYRDRPVYMHFTDYYIVWKKGIATTRFIDDRSFPVGRKADESALPFYIEKIGYSADYDGSYDQVDYIMTHGMLWVETMKHLRHFKLVSDAGNWKLYRREKSQPE